ncbi:MAG: hypothetical protein WCC74_00145 [Minisyncoccia bacterium]
MNKRKIIILIVVIIVLGFALNYLFSKKADTSTSALTVAVSSVEDKDAKAILKLLDDMSKATLIDNIFQLPVFLTLKDTSVTLVSQPIGRLNPFAPINLGEPSITISSSTKK